jgi:hypothetical protein
MLPADERVLRALVSLEDDPNFEALAEWLERRLTAIRAATDKQPNEVLLRWQQGRAQELVEFLDIRATAREQLHRTVTR